MNEKLVWFVVFGVLSTLTVYSFVEYESEVGSVYAYNDVLFYTTDYEYKMVDVLYNREFSVVRTIFLDNPDLKAYHVFVGEKLDKPRSKVEVNRLLDDDYPDIRVEYSSVRETFRSHGSSHGNIPMVS